MAAPVADASTMTTRAAPRMPKATSMPGGAAVDEAYAVGHAALEQVPDQDRPDRVVAAQDVAAADHQQLARLRGEPVVEKLVRETVGDVGALRPSR